MEMSEYRIQGATGEWEVVIGLEVHAQVTSNAKLFAGAATAFGASPTPGLWSMPRCPACCRAQYGVHSPGGAHRHGDRRRSTNGRVSTGRITSTPICRRAIRSASSTTRWWVRARSRSAWTRRTATKSIGVERIHVEQDAGKLMHDQHPTRSYVDLNRSGVALMEIVSRPDMRSPAEAGAYLRKLRAILRYVGSCDGNMEEGSMRADVNVSVRKPGDEFGTRTETKNVNSVRFVMAAIEHEAKRQVDVLEDGGKIVQETPLRPGPARQALDAQQGRRARLSLLPRSRSAAAGADDAFLEECRASLPELPDAKRALHRAGPGL
jgi:aspartyl-tRNA(Asn)/glutamyl-tRNA(Gln) amidotransferase subunit B